MTVPAQYVEASRDFMQFLVELRNQANLSTTNQAFTVAEGVLLTFRRRLDANGVARFASVLPPVLRAIFIAGWDPTLAPLPFEEPEAMTAEVQGLRPLHNYASSTSIRDVAVVLRRHVDAVAFDDCLARLPDGAERFWRTA